MTKQKSKIFPTLRSFTVYVISFIHNFPVDFKSVVNILVLLLYECLCGCNKCLFDDFPA